MEATKTASQKLAGPLPPVEDRIKGLLRSTERENVERLIEYLENGGFFTSPASTKYHAAYEGGLAEHSLRVFELMANYYMQFPDIDKVVARRQRPYPVTASNLIIASLLHDCHKIGAYLGTEAPYKWNKQQPEGHGELSIIRVSRIIVLEPIERMMIRFHMGIYGTREFYTPGSSDFKTAAEYDLRSHKKKGEKAPVTKEEKEADKRRRYCQSLRNCWYHNTICKLMYMCDELATMEATESEET